MTTQIDINDPKYREAARQMLWRHDNFEAEANVTSAVRDFLITTGLAASEEIVEENPPSEGSRRAVDLTALDTFIEVKRRISAAASGYPNAEYVRQLDDYLDQSAKDNRVRMGVLTDGRHWLLRWPNAGAPMMMPPHYFTLRDEDGWFSLYEWLRDEALFSQFRTYLPTPTTSPAISGPTAPPSSATSHALNALYQQLRRIRDRQGQAPALARPAARRPGRSRGAGTRRSPSTTCSSATRISAAVLSMVVQASFGIDIRRHGRDRPGRPARRAESSTTRQDCGECWSLTSSAWPKEVGANAAAERPSRARWPASTGGRRRTDTASTLYVTVIPPRSGGTLGEYYTPAVAGAKTMVRELVDKPLEQRVLDPACGSGTFLAEAVSNYRGRRERGRVGAREGGERPASRGHRNRRSSRRRLSSRARPGRSPRARPSTPRPGRRRRRGPYRLPVYLGDALQLRFRTGDLLAEREITIQTGDEDATELVFPVSLIDRAENFDAVIADVSTYITTGEDPYLALDDNHVTDEAERETLRGTIATLQRLHDEGRDHVWAYYARNMVRPLALSREKVDVVIGNPPWINYNQTADVLRTELQRLSRGVYGIWAGGRYATHQDVAGLFFCRSVDLYWSKTAR